MLPHRSGSCGGNVSETRRILLKLTYDGSGFCGWQKQHHQHSIQATLERAIKRMTGQDRQLVCSGRTDSGVHATSQYAHFDYEGRMSPEQIVKALNRLLDHDIRVLEARNISLEFHARYQAYERSYKYLLAKDIVPFQRLYMGYMVNQRLFLTKLAELSVPLLGKHDFSSFAQPNPEIPNRVCDVKSILITEHETHYEFIITADRFLHNMVRRIVGTLANCCTKELSPETIAKVLAEAHPKQTLVVPAPPGGLYLIDVRYPPEYFEPRG